MKAIGLTTYGGPEVLHSVDLPTVVPSAGQVRVRVRAAAVNPVDVLLRTGVLDGRFGNDHPPYVPGMDISGVIDAIGPDVDPALGLHVGQAVSGLVDSAGAFGGYSEQLVLPAASVTAAPSGADWAHAASFLMNAMAARNALDVLDASPGDTVLITGAAGALGTYAVALAHADGLRVVALAAPADEETLRTLGADEFVARGDDAADRVRQIAANGVDGVIDAAVLWDQIAPAIRDGGALIDLRGRDEQWERRIIVRHSNVRDRASDNAAITRTREQVEDGLLPMSVAATYPAGDAVAAHRRFDEGHLRGRVVLLFDEDSAA